MAINDSNALSAYRAEPKHLDAKDRETLGEVMLTVEKNGN
jgi:hypothetical protein